LVVVLESCIFTQVAEKSAEGQLPTATMGIISPPVEPMGFNINT